MIPRRSKWPAKRLLKRVMGDRMRDLARAVFTSLHWWTDGRSGVLTLERERAAMAEPVADAPTCDFAVECVRQVVGAKNAEPLAYLGQCDVGDLSWDVWRTVSGALTLTIPDALDIVTHRYPDCTAWARAHDPDAVTFRKGTAVVGFAMTCNMPLKSTYDTVKEWANGR